MLKYVYYLYLNHVKTRPPLVFGILGLGRKDSGASGGLIYMRLAPAVRSTTGGQNGPAGTKRLIGPNDSNVHVANRKGNYAHKRAHLIT